MGLKAVSLLQQAGKALTTSADEVAKYAKTCGKRSILETKPLQVKINPAELGWIRPDGVINFQTISAAENYAKNRCIFALRTSKPFERALLVKDNQVLAEVQGGLTNVNMERFSDKMIGATLFHGHPRIGGTTLPISLDDYFVLTSQKLKKIVAFNSVGEHSTLIQNSQKNLFLRLLPKKWQEKLVAIEQLGMGRIATSEYAKEYAKMFPNEVQRKAEQALHAQIGMAYGSRSKIAELQKSKFTMEELRTIRSTETQTIKDGTMATSIHNFWKRTAKKLDCIYRTDYTGL